MLDALKRLYRNTLFRLMLLAATLFVVSAIVSLGYVYDATVSAELRRIDKAMISEIKELETLYQERGFSGLNREIILRSSTGEGLYVMQYTITVNGEPQSGFAGNLAELPGRATERELGFFTLGRDSAYERLELLYSQRDTEGEDLIDRRARAFGRPLSVEGKQVGSILVGRDVEAIMRNAEQIKNAIITSAIIALILGLLSGWYVSRRFSRRIEGFNHLATEIRAGHLDRRAKRNHSGDELDLLAEHLNAMLDHISRLMTAMRYAGDSIAHDLRSPLTRLRTRLESAASDVKDIGASDALYAAADDAGELLRTFDSVLRIARLEAGERRELLVTLDPKPILDDIAELYEPSCEEAELTFSADIKSGLLILADRGLLSQAVSNLVENAIKYTPAGGSIELVLERGKSGRTEINVNDTGAGIPAQDRERVKERFVRLEKSRTEPGSGLGLAMVDAIADLHRAEFDLLDGKGGTGLTVRLTFPRVKGKKVEQSSETA